MSRILSWCRWWRTNAASLPVMRPADHAVDPPAGFRRALAELRTLVPRSEIELLEAPAPQRLAPYAIALTADVIVDDEDRGTGRLVLLHDPDGQDAWEGAWRVVVFAKATLEPEMAGDEMLSDVGWAFLNEALADSGAMLTAFGGTVTTTHSQPYGAMASREPSVELELRASWTPTDDEIAPHAVAWLALLGQMAGLEPIPPGVSQLRR